ncbi:amino acid ABC transporter substrate-binding protein [Pantoea sp. DY-15]|uniref:amino acid ABC transporter substrate-binding protein n=1 Tax=Pantoea sp. DY-15 TaxID=2871489 RepID=UPI001C9409AD|nr:amino acid ABC transporter substrate-binding protein [Pantoea sp. DY-15]MBY4890709.1 amino acid ABC transporter substrate-binding protein [Pantoea sp. DY-15]
MKLSGLVMCLCATVLLSACDQNKQANDTADVLRVGATPDGYPHYFKEGNELKGFSVDVLNAVAKKAGLKVEWVTSDWVGVLGSLQTGKVDTVGNFADTPERRKAYNFSTPYYYSAAQLAVSKNNNSVHGLSDLTGKTVAAELGSNYANVLKESDPEHKINLVTYEGRDVVVNAVAQGKADAFISGQVILLGQIKQKGLPLKVVGEPFGVRQVALPFRKDAQGDKLRQKVDTALSQLRDDGTLKSISEKWFDQDLSHAPSEGKS